MIGVADFSGNGVGQNQPVIAGAPSRGTTNMTPVIASPLAVDSLPGMVVPWAPTDPEPAHPPSKNMKLSNTYMPKRTRRAEPPDRHKFPCIETHVATEGIYQSQRTVSVKSVLGLFL
jgi:hypothetical protein